MRVDYVLPIGFIALFILTPFGAMGQQQYNANEKPIERGLMRSCFQETTIKVAGREQTVTLQDAERIKQTVERYLAEKKPKLEPNVFGPGEVFIDCEGVVRMGAWLLESSSLSGEGPSLSFRVLTNENFIVRQVIGLKLVEGQWEVTGVDRVTAHRSY
jgi:hypothetical protein